VTEGRSLGRKLGSPDMLGIDEGYRSFVGIPESVGHSEVEGYSLGLWLGFPEMLGDIEVIFEGPLERDGSCVGCEVGTFEMEGTSLLGMVGSHDLDGEIDGRLLALGCKDGIVEADGTAEIDGVDERSPVGSIEGHNDGCLVGCIEGS